MRLAPRHRTPMLRRMAYACFILLAVAALLFLVTSVTGISWIVAVAIVAGSLIVPVALEVALPALSRRPSTESRVRIAIIGDAGIARRLRDDLERAPRHHEFAGRIATLGDINSPGSVPVLARLGELRGALIEHDIQLLILSPATSRDSVFDELVSSCLDLPVRLVELSYFYEAVFGYVPISEMKAAWFQYLLDPSSRFPHPLAKRAIDLVATAFLAVAALPLVAVLVLLIRRDGGPAIFRQTRIGEGGRPFVLYKFRTMSRSSDASAQWAAVDDPRVTRVGRYLRRTHLDELPQLLNVLRGEMSLVGPRPEQPTFVERLEQAVPFYQRRHLIRPGISGWAQVRCGYARSDAGSVWKHCHDLFYLKHRSIGLDLWILAKTAALIVRGAIRRTEELAAQAAPAEPVAPQKPAVAEVPRVMVPEPVAPQKPAVAEVPRVMVGGNPQL